MSDKKQVNTDFLLAALESTENYDAFISENRESMGVDKLRIALRKLSAKVAMAPLDIIENSGIDRAYGYQIFNGTRKPSRDKLIQLAIGMQLSIRDSNYLLKCAEKLPLYAKSERDAIIIYALSHKYDIAATNDLLAEQQQQTI